MTIQKTYFRKSNIFFVYSFFTISLKIINEFQMKNDVYIGSSRSNISLSVVVRVIIWVY